MAHKIKNKWRGSVTVNGKRYTKVFTEKKLAQIWELQTKTNYEKKSLSLRVSDNEQIDKLIKKYINSCKGFKKTKTIVREEHSLNAFYEFCKKHLMFNCDDLNKKTWKKYIEFRKGANVSNRTVNIDLQTINRMFSWAVDDEIICNNPFSDAKKLREKTPNKPSYFTPEQVENLLIMMKEDHRFKTFANIFYVMVTTGIRSDELCNIKKSDVNFDNKQLFIRSENTKANYNRVVPLKRSTLDAIHKEIKKDSEYVFMTKTGRKYTSDKLSQRFRRIIRRAKQENILDDTKKYKLHNCRSTYISNLIMSGVEPQKVMNVVGHKDWSTVKRYLHLAPDYGSDVVDNLPY